MVRAWTRGVVTSLGSERELKTSMVLLGVGGESGVRGREVKGQDLRRNRRREGALRDKPGCCDTKLGETKGIGYP